MNENIQTIAPDRVDAILDLNNAHHRETSVLDAAKLRHMVRAAYRAVRVGQADAFLLAFDQDGDYDGTNFRWFKARYERFVYVDRIIVAAHARGRGVARSLYEMLFEAARADGHAMIACEINSEPPNPVSDAFHAALGFVAVGEAELYGGERSVRYFVRRLSDEIDA